MTKTRSGGFFFACKTSKLAFRLGAVIHQTHTRIHGMNYGSEPECSAEVLCRQRKKANINVYLHLLTRIKVNKMLSSALENE